MAWTVGTPKTSMDHPFLETFVDIAVSEVGPSAVTHGGVRAPKKVVIVPLNTVARAGQQAIQLEMVTSSLTASTASASLQFATTSTCSALYEYRIYFTFADFA